MAMANAKSKSMTALCRACHARIYFAEPPMLFDIVSCPECEETFEVTGLSPIRLDWPSDFDDEDWSDEDDSSKLSDV